MILWQKTLLLLEQAVSLEQDGGLGVLTQRPSPRGRGGDVLDLRAGATEKHEHAIFAGAARVLATWNSEQNAGGSVL